MKSAHYSSTAPSLPPSLHPAAAHYNALSPGYSPEPSRHSGLTSSSSASSSSAAMGASSLNAASNSAFGTQACVVSSSSSSSFAQARRAQHLPEELVSIAFSYLDLPQLLTAARVNSQWKEWHTSDEFWQPLYSRWYGDELRLNEQRDWKFNFRARDLMLSKLAPSISLLAHPDRHQRVESVTFLRNHCQFLKFILPAESGVEDDGMNVRQVMQQPQHGIEVAAQLHAQAAAAATANNPALTLASFYTPPAHVPVSLFRSDRQPLPDAHTLELRHAQHIVKDALVNHGWRALFQHMKDYPGVSVLTPRYVSAGQVARSAATHAEVAFAATGAMDGLSAEERQSESFPFVENKEEPREEEEEEDEAMDEERKDNSSSSASSSSSSPSSPVLAHHLRLIEYGAVLVAWTECPYLSFHRVTAELDALAQQVRERMDVVQEEKGGHVLSFTEKLQSLHHVLYTVLRFHGNDANYYDVRNSFVHFVLKERTGIPISMAIVYMAIAVRLGIHVEGVNSPGHFLLRVQDGPAASSAAAQTHQTPSQAAGDADVTMSSRRASPTMEDTTAGSTAAPTDAHAETTYFIDAFSGQMMTPATTLRFLSLVTQGDEDVDAVAAAALQSQLRVCSPAALFVRMYRNLMNLYQNPAYHRNRIPIASTLDEAQASAHTQYEMEAYLHHCASQILELMRLAGESTPDVLTSMFIERFRYGGGMS